MRKKPPAGWPGADPARLSGRRPSGAHPVCRWPAWGDRPVIGAQSGSKRKVVASVPYFSLAPYVLLQNDILFSAPRLFAEHCCSLGELCMAESPLEFPRCAFYLLWHDRAHHGEEGRWFREQVVDVIRETVGTLHAAREHAPARPRLKPFPAPGATCRCRHARDPQRGASRCQRQNLGRHRQEGALRHQVRLSMDESGRPGFWCAHRHAA